MLWSGLCCYTEGWGGKCSEILAMIKLLYNPRVNKVFTSLHFAYNNKSTTYNDKRTTYNVKSTTYNGQSTAYNALGTAYNAKSTAYNEKSTAYNEGKSHKTVLAFHSFKYNFCLRKSIMFFIEALVRLRICLISLRLVCRRESRKTCYFSTV